MTDRTAGRQWGTVVADASADNLEFSAVYRSNYDFVWRCVRRLGVPPGLVDDTTQDVFVIVHRRLHTYDGRAPVRSWLFGILRRVASEQRRRNERIASPPRPPPRDDPSGPEDQVARREAADWVERFLERLDDEQRAVFVLAECEGTPVVEIARTLGIKTNTAYSRLRLARRRFERALQRAEATDEARTRSARTTGR